MPRGWSYGQALLLKQTGPAQPGQSAPTANDTSILLGRLDLEATSRCRTGQRQGRRPAGFRHG